MTKPTINRTPYERKFDRGCAGFVAGSASETARPEGIFG